VNNRRLYNVLQGSRTTEKTHEKAEKYKQITFRVAKDATKTEIKKAVEKIFNVAVEAVRVCNVKGKTKKFRQRQGCRSDWKKAMVSLREGHDINLAEFE
jgi:large subunit ribosomal protein L23